MADRTSARIFGDLFDLLAKQPQDERTRKLAIHVLEMTNDYDFTTDQMSCDAALATLGIDSMIGEEDSLDAPAPASEEPKR